MSNHQLICHFCGHHDPAATLGVRCPADGSVLVPSAEHDKSPADSILGRFIGGKYAIIGMIGSGAMGAVYKALQEPVGREVAIKVIRHADPTKDEEVRARFLREAKIAAKLSNPAAVTLFDYGTEKDGVLYMVMELIRGRTLAEALAEGVFPPERIVPISSQVLYALSEAHELGLVHRDIKPANIMLVRGSWGEELAKVLDFGIAKARESSDETFKTRAGLVLGTPLYMAPEQAHEREVDGRADLYSVGVMLYQALTGQLPFSGGNAFEVLLAHRDKPVPPFPTDRFVPPALQEVVFQALAKKPEERFATAAAMAKALMAALPVGSQPTQEAKAMSPSASGGVPSVSSSSAPDLEPLEEASTMIKPAGQSSEQQPLPAAPAEAPAAAEPAPSETPVNEPAPQAAAPAAAMAAVPAPVPAKKGSSSGLVIGIVLGVLVLLIGGTAVGGWFALKKFRGAEGTLGRLAAMLPGEARPDGEVVDAVLARPDHEALDDGDEPPAASGTQAAADDDAADDDQAPAAVAADDAPDSDSAAAGDDQAPAADVGTEPVADDGVAADDGVVAADDAADDIDAAGDAVADEGTYTEKVLFEDAFKRANSGSVGNGWNEYLLRGNNGRFSLKPGNGDWVIRTGTLSLWLRGSTKELEDLVLTAARYPVEGSRIEFEMRGELPGTANAGAVVGWVSEAQSLSEGLKPGNWLGASFAAKDGAILANAKAEPQPALREAGFNPSRWVKHTVTVSKGVLSYQVGQTAPVTVDIEPALEAGETRHFFFGIRARTGAVHKIDVRNFRVIGKVKAVE